MVKNYKRLAVSEETFNIVINDCITEFLKHNPKMEGLNISHDFIIRKMSQHYLGDEIWT